MVVTVTPTRRRSNGNEDTVCRYVEHTQDCMHIKEQVVQLLNVDDPMRFILRSTAVVWCPYPRMVHHKQRAHIIQDLNGIQMGLAQLSFHRTCQLEEDFHRIPFRPIFFIIYLIRRIIFLKTLSRAFLFEVERSSFKNLELVQPLSLSGLGGSSKVAGSCCVQHCCVFCVYRFLNSRLIR